MQARTKDFALIKIDVTGWTADNLELLVYLDVQGPRTVFTAETEHGSEVEGTRSVGDFSVDDLVVRLESV